MRLARTFHTSIGHTKQSFYPPYITPLNGEQKKALRKLMLAKKPQLHTTITKDVELILKTYSVSESTMNKRRNTLQRVKEIIKSAFGSRYSVIDRSLSQYSRDFEYAPLELAIMDETRPIGFAPEQIEPQFPDAYNHEALAKLFQSHGYSGSFIAGDAMRNQPPFDPNVPRPPISQTERGPHPEAHPWPTYTPYPTLYPTYPPVLSAVPGPGNLSTMSFYISPPVPTHAPLLRLLRSYASMSDHVRDMITFVFLWTRSIGMTELTPTCVALMVVGWLQNRKIISSLQNPTKKQDAEKLAEQNDGVWFTSGRPSHDNAEPMLSSTWLETGFMTPDLARPPNTMTGLLDGFFRFWSLTGDDTFLSSAQYISVREGAVMGRAQKMHTNTPLLLKQDKQAIDQGFSPSSYSQPLMWQSQPIVVQDPFVPSFNHAHAVSKAAGTYFQYICTLSLRTMTNSCPVTAIIGDKLPRPPSPRSHSTIPISLDIKRIYETSLPPQPILDSRQRAISRVQRAIRERFGNGYTVECFGSTRYGVGTPRSDLDLTIIDQKNVNGFSLRVDAKELPAIYNIRVVARTLMKNGFVNVVAIPKATVPIVKFRDPTSNLDCDLNINEQLGLWNTQLIAQYCELSPDFLKPLILVIKRWAKSHGINDASGMSGPRSFSSYALVLMTIGYLQVRGGLPSLQEGFDRLPNEAKQGMFWLRNKGKDSVRCDIRFKSGLNWTPPVGLSLEEAFAGWFRFWANEYKYEEHILSIREGQLLRRHKKIKRTTVTQETEGMTNYEGTTADPPEDDADETVSDLDAGQPSKWKNDTLIVADPFILSKNVCGNVGDAMIHRFCTECRRSAQMLEWGADLKTLMGDEDPSQPPKPTRKGGPMGGTRGKRGKGAGRTEVAPGGDIREATSGWETEGQSNPVGEDGRRWRQKRSHSPLRGVPGASGPAGPKGKQHGV